MNYELIRLLCSYGKDLIVLHSDGTIVDDIRERIREMNENIWICEHRIRNRHVSLQQIILYGEIINV